MKSANVFKLIEKDRADVWRALTRREALTQWLCEEADVAEPRAGAKYALKSRIPHVSGRHTIDALEPGEWLRFDWDLRGHATSLSLRLEDHAGWTRVVVKHEVPDDLPAELHVDDLFGGKCGFLANVWGYSLDLLKDYVEQGRAQCRLKAAEDPLRIDMSIELKAKPAEVFAHLTQVDRIRKWNPFCGEGVKVEPRVGGRYSFGWSGEDQGKDGPGEIVAYEDGKKLTYTWHGKDKTMVSWEVEPLPGEAGARLHFVHSGFVQDPELVWEYKLGWAGFLHLIRESLEGSRPVTELGGGA